MRTIIPVIKIKKERQLNDSMRTADLSARSKETYTVKSIAPLHTYSFVVPWELVTRKVKSESKESTNKKSIK